MSTQPSLHQHSPPPLLGADPAQVMGSAVCTQLLRGQPLRAWLAWLVLQGALTTLPMQYLTDAARHGAAVLLLLRVSMHLPENQTAKSCLPFCGWLVWFWDRTGPEFTAVSHCVFVRGAKRVLLALDVTYLFIYFNLKE